PITLVQSTGDALQSFLLLMPVYKTFATPATVAEREAAGIGWAYAPLLIREVLGEVNIDRQFFGLTLIDITDPKQPRPVYASDSDGKGANASRSKSEAVLLHTTERTIYGRRFMVQLEAKPAFMASVADVKPSTVLTLGLLATLLAMALAAAIGLSQQRKRTIALEQARRATIIENSSDAIISQALDGTIISWNRAAERLFGYPEQLVLGQKLANFLVPDDRADEDETLLRRIAAGENVQTFDTVRLHRDGTPIDVAVTVGPVREADGRISGAAKHLRDIRSRIQESRRLKDFSARLEREVELRTLELKRANTLLSDVLRAASEVSIVATDVYGTITLFNRGAEQMLGYTADEMIGKQTPALVHIPEEVQAYGEALSLEFGRVILGFRVFVHRAEMDGSELRRWTYLRKDGSTLQVNVVVTTMRDDKGTITGYLGIAEDITETLQVSEALQQAKLAAESASIAKGRFLATMSHELRTPINGILGMAQMLLQPDVDAQTLDKYVRIILGSGQTLLALLSDILDFSKIEAGKIELENVPFSPEQIMREVETLFSNTVLQKGLSCSATWNGPAGVQCLGDPFRIRQMLTNLVSNAVKFTAHGSITIEVTQVSRSPRSASLEFAVVDTGIGIPEDVRAGLFQPFVQAENSTTRKFGGTGLGLSIVRSLSVLMGGETGVSSTLGQGSRFWFRIPVRLDLRGGRAEGVAAEHARTAGPAAVVPQRDRPRLMGTVLVAEDVITNRLVIEAMLNRFGLTFTMVEDGAKAVAEINDDHPYDLILMDVQMPVMDGYDATRAIRRWESETNAKSIPILALTAAVYESDRAEAVKAGMNGFLPKPLNIDSLHKALAEHLPLA
ncbi:MAG: PAS domain S-box protein, partial [Rhodospirillaceae bacterium]|nr:PAS domain S-box protein [Rhodospirillaceae bacterium]